MAYDAGQAPPRMLALAPLGALVLAFLVERSVRSALATAGAVGVAILLAFVELGPKPSASGLVLAGGTAWFLVDHARRTDPPELSQGVLVILSCSLAALALYVGLPAEIGSPLGVPIISGAVAAILLGPIGGRRAPGSVHPADRVFDRWVSAIFWCLAGGVFCALVDPRAVPTAWSLPAFGLALLLSVAGAWLFSMAGAFAAAGAVLACGALTFAWDLPRGLALGLAVVTALGASRRSSLGVIAGGAGVAAALALLLDVSLPAALIGALLVPLWVRSAVALVALRRQRLREDGLSASLQGWLSGEIATCFGAGYAPRGSGTVGAVTALPIGWLLAGTPVAVRAAVLVLVTGLSIAVAYGYMAGGTKEPDPKEVVFDEHIGVLIAFAVVPWEWPWVAAAFVLFRIFDIWKPGPVGLIDRKMKNPAGIMMDDVVAGLLAAVLLLAVRFVV